jgi:hypothetical protein
VQKKVLVAVVQSAPRFYPDALLNSTAARSPDAYFIEEVLSTHLWATMCWKIGGYVEGNNVDCLTFFTLVVAVFVLDLLLAWPLVTVCLVIDSVVLGGVRAALAVGHKDLGIIEWW